MTSSATRFLKISILVILVVAVLFAVSAWWTLKGQRVADLPAARPNAEKTAPSAPQTDELKTAPMAATLAKNLEVPWAMAFLPDQSMLFTERPGRIRLIDKSGTLRDQPVAVVSDVAAVGEGGLLGLTVHPDFSRNLFVYLYYTYNKGDALANRLVRYVYQNKTLTDRKVIIEDIPGNSIHNAGRIKFGPDGLLYIATGDAADSKNARDKSSLAGKILRLTDDGKIPADNPFTDSPVYSYGHRDPQGLAWDTNGRLWATEHGPTGHDEVNLINPGRDYGWPTIVGEQTSNGLESPVIQSGSDTWAPAGAVFYKRHLLFAGLRGQSIFKLDTGLDQPQLSRFFENDFGRIRDIELGPDGFLYIMTSNRDGRGLPTSDDDQIIRLNPQKIPDLD